MRHVRGEGKRKPSFIWAAVLAAAAASCGNLDDLNRPPPAASPPVSNNGTPSEVHCQNGEVRRCRVSCDPNCEAKWGCCIDVCYAVCTDPADGGDAGARPSDWGKLCGSCEFNGDCGPGAACIQYGLELFCSTPCGVAGTCPDGYSCVSGEPDQCLPSVGTCAGK